MLLHVRCPVRAEEVVAGRAFHETDDLTRSLEDVERLQVPRSGVPDSHIPDFTLDYLFSIRHNVVKPVCPSTFRTDRNGQPEPESRQQVSGVSLS